MGDEIYESITTADPLKVRYFHGRITREEAERRLAQVGHVDGLYLLRDHLFHDGYFVLSIYNDGAFTHFVIVRNFQDGTLALQGSKRPFTGPIELVGYYSRNPSLLPVQLKKPCLLPVATTAATFAGFSREELKQEMISIALMHKLSKDEIRKTLSSPKRPEFERLTRKFLHQKRSWFHGAISKKTVEKRLRASGYRDGRFLVRLKSRTNTYYLSVCYKGSVIHYKITMDTFLGQVSIEARESKYFDSLLALVDYYEKRKEILANLLSEPCDIKEHKANPIHERRILISGPMTKVFKKILEIDDLDSIKFSNRGPRPRFIPIDDGLESVSKAATSKNRKSAEGKNMKNNIPVSPTNSYKRVKKKKSSEAVQAEMQLPKDSRNIQEDTAMVPPPISPRVTRNETNSQQYLEMVHMANRFRSISMPPLDPIREKAEDEATSVISRVSSIGDTPEDETNSVVSKVSSIRENPEDETNSVASKVSSIASSIEAVGPVISNPQGNYRLCLIRVPENGQNEALKTLSAVSRTPTSDYQSSETSSVDTIVDSGNNTIERQSHRKARENRETRVHFEK